MRLIARFIDDIDQGRRCGIFIPAHRYAFGGKINAGIFNLWLRIQRFFNGLNAQCAMNARHGEVNLP